MARREYARASEAAEAEGLTAICARGDLAELMALGDAARFAKRTGTAEFVWRHVRERFPRDERASLAAFHLGRMAFDERASYLEAALWFRTYLTERPDGALAREALGRMMEALDRHGDREGSKEAAVRYLKDFPNGPHADFARNLVAR
jgi:transmembrane sensor